MNNTLTDCFDNSLSVLKPYLSSFFSQANVEIVLTDIEPTTEPEAKTLDSNLDSKTPVITSIHQFANLPFTKRFATGLIVLTKNDVLANEQKWYISQINRFKELFCQQTVCVLGPQQNIDLTPFGFIRHEAPEWSGSLWTFNYFDYKKRPEWLNSRFWANPENWDKFRW